MKSLWRTESRENVHAVGLLLLRLGVGGLLLVNHAARKLDSMPALIELVRARLSSAAAPAIAWTAALVELIGSVLIILGLGTRLAAPPLLLTLLLALTVVHLHDPWHYLHESLLLFLTGLLTLLCTGAGRYSLDHWLATRAERTGSNPGGI